MNDVWMDVIAVTLGGFADQRFSIPDRLVTHFARHDDIPPSRTLRDAGGRVLRRASLAGRVWV
jgi:hypothetical protein